MPKKRTPTALAEITGRTMINPSRYKDRANPYVPKIGKPYNGMNLAEVTYWNRFVEELPWLRASDRQQLKLLCQLSVQYDNDHSAFPVNKLNMIRQILNSFGGSPADRSKVYAPDEDNDDDPAWEFLS